MKLIAFLSISFLIMTPVTGLAAQQAANGMSLADFAESAGITSEEYKKTIEAAVNDSQRKVRHQEIAGLLKEGLADSTIQGVPFDCSKLDKLPAPIQKQ